MDLLRTSEQARTDLTANLALRAQEHLKTCIRQASIAHALWTEISKKIALRSPLDPNALDLIVRSKRKTGREKLSIAEIAELELQNVGLEPKEETLALFFCTPLTLPSTAGMFPGTTNHVERRVVAIAHPRSNKVDYTVNKRVTSTYVTGGTAFKGNETVEMHGTNLAGALEAIRAESTIEEIEKNDLRVQVALLEYSGRGFYSADRLASIIDEIRASDAQSAPDNYDTIEELAVQVGKEGLSPQNLATVLAEIDSEPIALLILGLLKKASKELYQASASNLADAVV
jgi:hypothetical protein